MDLNYRLAEDTDLVSLVMMLANDNLGKTRESTRIPLDSKYLTAFAAIKNDANNELWVAEQVSKKEVSTIGMLQITYIPYLTHVGSWRCLIEGVRMHKDFRGQGLGEALFKFAIGRAKEKGCKIVQLTSDKKRSDAIRFYEKLGFRASHEGMKLAF